jgi:thiol:disulfide interchange protein DsbG
MPARVIYVFTDPECPYCNVLWNDLQHADLSAVQIRHLIVAVVTPQSRDAAAAILEASDPARALAAHERRYRKQAVAPYPKISSATRETLAVNFSLMDSLGIYATPAVVYDDEDGRVSVFSGVPSAAQLQKMLRPLTPADEVSPTRAGPPRDVRRVP